MKPQELLVALTASMLLITVTTIMIIVVSFL